MDEVVVLEYGSQTFRAGTAYHFPTDEEPRVVTPSAVRMLPAEDSAMDTTGQEAKSEGADTLRQAVDQGSVVDWQAFESILHYILYNQMGWELGQEGSLLVAEPLFTSKADREQLTQLLFEEFNVSGLFLCDAAVLAMYAAGKLSGTVVDFGHTKTDVATVLDGQLYLPASHRLPHGGRDLTAYLGRLLSQRGGAQPPPQLLAPGALEHLKELCARVPESQEELASPAEPQTYTLPDGQQVDVGGEGLLLGEALVRPAQLGLDLPPVAEAVFASAAAHPDPAMRKMCLDGIMPCGGGALAAGLRARLLRDLRTLAPPALAPGLAPVPEYMPPQTPHWPAWMGGAVLSKVVFAQNQHITKADYDELGPVIVHRKCG